MSTSAAGAGAFLGGADEDDACSDILELSKFHRTKGYEDRKRELEWWLGTREVAADSEETFMASDTQTPNYPS